DHDDGRLLLGELAQRLIKLLGARGRAAWAVDVDDYRAHARFAEAIERLDSIFVAADQALNRNPGDVVARGFREFAARPRQCDRRGDAPDHEEDRDHAPEGELTPKASAIDDGV